MKLLISLDCDNDAFQPAPTFEIARILREYCDRIEDMEDRSRVLRDSNGLTVGRATAEDDQLPIARC